MNFARFGNIGAISVKCRVQAENYCISFFNIHLFIQLK